VPVTISTCIFLAPGLTATPIKEWTRSHTRIWMYHLHSLQNSASSSNNDTRLSVIAATTLAARKNVYLTHSDMKRAGKKHSVIAPLLSGISSSSTSHMVPYRRFGRKLFDTGVDGEKLLEITRAQDLIACGVSKSHISPIWAHLLSLQHQHRQTGFFSTDFKMKRPSWMGIPAAASSRKPQMATVSDHGTDDDSNSEHEDQDGFEPGHAHEHDVGSDHGTESDSKSVLDTVTDETPTNAAISVAQRTIKFHSSRDSSRSSTRRPSIVRNGLIRKGSVSSHSRESSLDRRNRRKGIANESPVRIQGARRISVFTPSENTGDTDVSSSWFKNLRGASVPVRPPQLHRKDMKRKMSIVKSVQRSPPKPARRYRRPSTYVAPPAAVNTKPTRTRGWSFILEAIQSHAKEIQQRIQREIDRKEMQSFEVNAPLPSLPNFESTDILDAVLKQQLEWIFEEIDRRDLGELTFDDLWVFVKFIEPDKPMELRRAEAKTFMEFADRSNSGKVTLTEWTVAWRSIAIEQGVEVAQNFVHEYAEMLVNTGPAELVQ
jgi:hypothetical protein